MTLRRTSSALKSMHVFYRADVVVFCEGGQSKDFTEALQFSQENRTLDGVFWSTMLQLADINKNLHFKSVGSKTTLSSIASDIITNNISTVSICLNRDYDGIFGSCINHSRVAYTLGYSWESDVMSYEVILEILQTLIGKVEEETVEELCKFLDKFRADLTKWCEIDIALKYRGKPCVLDRKNPLTSVDLSRSPPELWQSRLRERLTDVCGYATRPRRVYSVVTDHVLKISFGKLVSKFCYWLVIHYAKSIIDNMRIDYDNFMKMAIRFTFRRAQTGANEDIKKHYESSGYAF